MKRGQGAPSPLVEVPGEGQASTARAREQRAMVRVHRAGSLHAI